MKNYFKEKVAWSLASRSTDVIFDPATVSPVPGLLARCLRGQDDFIEVSKKIATHLHQSQTGANPSGLLALIEGTMGTRKALAVLKLEKEEGVRVEQTGVVGQRTFNIEHLRNLMLTENTRVFKVGLFPYRDESDEVDCVGAVSDNQRGYGAPTSVADFFLRKFLGCELCEQPEITTQRFFMATQEFINSEVLDPQSKAKYQIALVAELSSESDIVVPQAFAGLYLSVNDRQPFLEFLAERKIEQPSFDKDNALIETHLRRIQMDLESGLALIGPSEVIDNRVSMQNLPDGRTHFEFDDRIKRVQAKS